MHAVRAAFVVHCDDNPLRELDQLVPLDGGELYAVTVRCLRPKEMEVEWAKKPFPWPAQCVRLDSDPTDTASSSGS